MCGSCYWGHRCSLGQRRAQITQDCSHTSQRGCEALLKDHTSSTGNPEKWIAVSADLGDLLDWKLPAQFETELVSEAFDDIAAKKCSQLIESLMERMGSLQSALQRHVKDSEDDTDYFTLFSAPGTSWKSELTESCSPEEILQAAKGSVLAKLPIKELKEFSSSIEKEP